MPDIAALLPNPEEIETLVREQLGESAIFAARFREAAARALLLPRRRAGARMPLWSQRLRAQNLMAVAKQFSSFPIILEAYRECLAEAFDIPTLTDVLRQIRDGTIRVDVVETQAASPFSQSLIFAYVAAFLYDGDAPVAERQAQALRLDQPMLDKLLGKPSLRSLLDADAVASVETRIGPPKNTVRSADHLHDILRKYGDLSRNQIDQVCAIDAASMIAELTQQTRIIAIRYRDQVRYIAVEDAGRYRDALGVKLPDHIPQAFLEPKPSPLQSLIARWARHRGPFVPEQCAQHFGISQQQVQPLLINLHQGDQFTTGEIRPGATGTDWCDTEVLSQLKKATIAKLRRTIAPVDGATLARFYVNWHRVCGSRHRGMAGLRRALTQLAGIPIALSQLETAILPARVSDYQPRYLDELGHSGEFVWVGHGPIGTNDGRISWYSRDDVSALLIPPTIPTEPLPALHQSILEYLDHNGASFTSDLQHACQPKTAQQLFEAIWQLSWQGLITNDSVQPLRTAGIRRHTAKKRRRVPRNSFAGISGRWSTVQSLITTDIAPTEQSMQRTQQLLDRYGIMSRESLAGESLSGGFTPIYRVLDTMEQVGKVRRGHFVQDLSSAQFALPNAVERLRNQRDIGVTVIATMDPANPYGTMLAWPKTTSETARPSRRGGVCILLHNGAPILLFEPKGHLFSFADRSDNELQTTIQHGFPQLLRLRPKHRVEIHVIDDQPARTHPLSAHLRAANFHDEYRSLVLDRSRLEMIRSGAGDWV